MKIAVAGGAGLVGKFVVMAAENRGHEVFSKKWN
jgi:nucleoside-diphosphate-sugar epimerase